MAIKPRKGSYIGIHFDFHANDDCLEIGKRTTDAMIQHIIDRVHPDYIQCDCKGHRGLSSYPTKVGNPAPGFVYDENGRDNLRIWRDVTKKNGVPLYMHYSGVWDTEVISHHPDWAVIDADGNPSPTDTSFYSPYVDEVLIPQLKELIDKYEVDGVWIDGDCWRVYPDYGEAAKADFTAQTGITDIPKAWGEPHWDEWMAFTRNNFFKYLAHYVDALHEYAPGFQVASNWAYTSRMPQAVNTNVDFISGDYPMVNSYNVARMEGRSMLPQGITWDLMAWAFTSGKGGGKVIKTPTQLKQEAACILALGGGFQAYFNQKRDGSIAEWQMELIGQVSDFAQERKEWCFGTKPVHQVVLYNGTENSYHRRQPNHFVRYNGICDCQQGVLMALLDNQYSVEVLSDHHLQGDLSSLPVIVLPETEVIPEEMRKKLLDYVANGGSLLCEGARSAQLFMDELGCKPILYAGEPEVEQFIQRFNGAEVGNFKARPVYERLSYDYTCFVKVNDRLGGVCGITTEVLPKDGTEVLAWAYTSNDITGRKFPAATIRNYGKGKIAAVWSSIGADYAAGSNINQRDLIGLVMDKLFKPTFTVKGSHLVDCELSEKPGSGAMLLQLVNTGGSHSDSRTITFDEVPPLFDLQVELRNTPIPAKVVQQPEGIELPFTCNGSDFSFTVPKLDIFSTIEFVY